MNNFTKKLILVSSVFLALHGCNSSNKTISPTPIEPPLPPVSVPIAADDTLPLDYTFSLSTLGAGSDILAGATLNVETGNFVILGEGGLLIYLSPQGTISNEIEIEGQGSAMFTGIEYIEGSNYVVSTSDSKIFILDEETKELDELVQLDFNIDAVAYDKASGSTIVIDDGSPSRIVSISSSGVLSETELESEIQENSVTGLTISDDVLLIASVLESSDESLIISASMTGEIGQVWTVESDTTAGLTIVDPEAPEILIPNSDSDQTITLFAAPTPSSVPSNEVLILNSSPELDFNQPSGVNFTPETSELYYVTDFGEVRKGTSDGVNELLFEIDVRQGSFEGIIHIASNDTLALMMSTDLAEESDILTFDMQGNQLSSLTVPIIDNTHKFESMDYNSNSNTYVAVTASEGQKVLYEFTTDGPAKTTNLVSDYDDFIISGISLSQDGTHLYLITEEWEDEAEVLNAGLLIKVDLSTNTELARYSAAVEVDGEIVGITDPSDVAVDEMNNLIFITSDIDGSILYVFEGF